MSDAERRLAAILSADVAGYSRLMGADEEATVATLAHSRKIFHQAIARRGRVVDTAGDSVLAEFASVVEAVRAALAIQDELAERNAALADERRMRFRIGVNLGDIIGHDDGTIYGDGVNVAARLESLAEPGGICLSEAAHMQVDGKLDLTFRDMGEHEVKNIARPVRAWQVVTEDAPLSAPVPVLPDKPSIAVLPFANMSGDPEQEYFSDGISEDVITDISKVSGLFVIARNSSFSYKGKSPKIDTVCRELGVRHVLEGSVRKAGSRVRITAQLIDGTTGGHLWAERYDRDLSDIFAVQDEVAQAIVAALKVTLTPAEQTGITRRGTRSVEAHDAFIRGREWTSTWSRDGHARARTWLEKARELDPGFADPLALLSMIQAMAAINGWADDWRGTLESARGLAAEAVALDDASPHAHYALGTSLLWLGRHEKAAAESELAITLDPNMTTAHGILGMIHHYAGDSAAAIDILETGQQLDPISNQMVLHQIALCHFMLGDYEAAAALSRERIQRAPSTDASRVLLVAACGHLGRTDEALATWQDLMAINPDYSFAEKRKILPYKNPADLERIADGLRKAGIDT